MDRQTAEILKIAKDLIKFPSITNDAAALRPCLQYCKKYFSRVPQAQVTEYTNHGFSSLVVTSKNNPRPTVMMMGHLDVVSALKPMFLPKIRQGKLFGRGACDMKSEVAAMMCLMRRLLIAKKPASVGLILTTDEEIGGHYGAEYLIKKIGYQPKVVLIPDGGGDQLQEIVYQSKGVIHLRLTAQGKSAHGSRPWLGTNAADLLLDDYLRVKKCFPRLNPPDYWHGTCVLGTIGGGKATNQVPDHAFCTLDVRYSKPTDYEKIIKKIQSSVKFSRLEIITEGSPSVTSLEDRYLKIFVAVLKDEFNLRPIFTRSHGSHDGRFFTERGIPVIISRPLSGGQHSDREWVDIKSLGKFYKLYSAFIDKTSTL